jgi:hypothetical protein
LVGIGRATLLMALCLGLAACAAGETSAGPADSRGSAQAPGQPSGTFVATGSMATPRLDHTATRLDDGRVLIAGGDEGGAAFFSAEIYDPASGTFSPTGSLGMPRDWQTATLLTDGRVLIAGGGDNKDQHYDSAEIYDPVSGGFSPTGSMATARLAHTATRLEDGRVLIAGGDNGGSINLASAELYDPETNEFSPTGSMAKERAYHTATLLTDGRVLIVGGCRVATECKSTPVASAEIYDPNGGTFSSAGATVTARAWHAAAPLPDGRVLVAGGYSAEPRSLGSGLGETHALSSAETWNPQYDTFSETSPMAKARWDFAAAQLYDGRILVTGGQGEVSKALASVEVYDPQMGSFSPTGSMGTARDAHTATALQDGRVLVAGGRDADNWPTATAELYQP